MLAMSYLGKLLNNIYGNAIIFKPLAQANRYKIGTLNEYSGTIY
jgi:hypothetical protein